MPRRDILLVEGRETETQSLAGILESESYPVRKVPTILEAEAMWEQLEPAMVVINWPTLDVIEQERAPAFARQLAGTPVICAGHKGDPEKPKPHGMVFLAPPVSARRLLNQARRFVPDGRQEERMLCVGDLTLNLNRRVVTVLRQRVQYLTPQQAGVLACLLKRAGEVVSRRALMSEVWHTDFLDDTRTLDVHIRWLREAIELDPGKPQRLMTVRGQGYKLIPQEIR